MSASASSSLLHYGGFLALMKRRSVLEHRISKIWRGITPSSEGIAEDSMTLETFLGTLQPVDASDFEWAMVNEIKAFFSADHGSRRSSAS